MDHPSSRRDAVKPAAERGVIMSVVQDGMGEPHIAAAPPVAPGDRYLGAFELLESASKALDGLDVRRDHLETALEDVSRRAGQAIAASADRAADWERLAAELRIRNADLERQSETLTRRAELAEAQCASERERADTAERRAAEAQHLLRRLHDKVVSASAQGTGAFDILSAVLGKADRKVMARPKISQA